MEHSVDLSQLLPEQETDEEEYYCVPVEDVDPPHSDEHPICPDPTCPCKQRDQDGMSPEGIRAYMLRGGLSEQEVDADLATLVYGGEEVRRYRRLINEYLQKQGQPTRRIPFVRVDGVLYAEEL